MKTTMSTKTPTVFEESGVFELLTDLCGRIATNHGPEIPSTAAQKRLANRMRSCAFEIILKKTSKEFTPLRIEPIVELLSYYFVLKKTVRNVAEHNRAVSLKNIISKIRQTDYGEDKNNIYNVLRLLVALSDSVKEDYSSELFQNPFTFGKLDEMLPRLPREAFGSAQPYTYYPGHMFDLPYSLKQTASILDNQKSQTYADYTVESFDSRSLFPDNITLQKRSSDIRTFHSPMSLASLTSTRASAYCDSIAWNFPRLTAPRDIQIPEDDPPSTHRNLKVTFASRETALDVKEVFCTNSDKTVDIWEIATQVDKDIPNDIWEIASKMPVLNERQLISTSSREVALWRKLYADQLCDLDIISEKQFIRHIMYLLIGVETSTFPFCEQTNSFYMKEDLILEGVSKEHIRGYVSDLLLVGTYYRRLYKFAFNISVEDHCHSNGLVYEAAREVIRRYLLDFRLSATEIYEDSCRLESAELNNIPTLLRTLYHIEPLKREIETIASIYKLIGPECRSSLPNGAELMSYLFDEISLVTHQATCITVFNSLFSICSMYFKFIERFIFDGELEDKYNEFFIRKDAQYVNTRSKRYWDKGFHISQSQAVPEFLRPLAKFILLCGKSLRLLKQCNPNDPLVLLISSDHPTVKCCATFEDLERQQQVLDVYRTRCLFVSGEPMTFEQILLNREAERKAFTEMASIKQAETMEKIVAERKRLAQLIIAEKQHSLRVLEAAMAEAKAAKQRVKQRERKLCDLEREADKATEEVDSKLKDIEKNKLMEYYSKLNMEVEKTKIHTEWKMRRLQLDQARMQLLSSEERNLKREKLELEHQKNEEIMAMSIQSIDTQDEVDDNEQDKNVDGRQNKVNDITESTESFVTVESNDKTSEDNSHKTRVSSQVFSAICNVAKSVFGRSRSDSKCDNKNELDSQGNVITVDSENNESVQLLTKSSDVIGDHFDEKLRHVMSDSENVSSQTSVKSSDVIGGNLNEKLDNEVYLKGRDEAMKNKLKVMSHEFHQTDKENNQKIDCHDGQLENIDEENNKTTLARSEARRNKIKVLGSDFAIVESEKQRIFHEPVTEAQKQALINKKKVLGVEYNLPIDNVYKREPACKAQEEALQNKQKILGSQHVQPIHSGPRRDLPKRSGLTLNLKPYSEMSSNTHSVTPNTGAITPGDFFPGLDLETPTTADIPLEGAMTADVFTPDVNKGLDDISVNVKSDKKLLGSESFNLSLIVDEETEGSDVMGEINLGETPQSSPAKSFTLEAKYNKYSVINLIDGTYSFEDFDPFGVRDMKSFSKDHFTSRMNLALSSTSYTHPAIIMQEACKKPYANIFASHFGDKEEEIQKIKGNNIATLTACLQRSVMLPLTYQLEVVNSSILTYFLVDLDMYDHMRSLKDYFFLMDGEFSRSICNNLFARLTKTLNPQELLNFATLHSILDKSLGSSISHVHKFSDNLSFTITESPLSFQHSSPDVLQCLSLTYTVSWPLNILLSQEALLRYARVFQFLIKMRRISWVLGEDFESLKLAAKLSREHSRKLERSPQYISVQIYRHIMASMVRALDNYIVTTCILSSWKEFENDLKKAKTLDDLYDCHVVYIKKVLFRCLLNNRSTPIMKLLNDIFTVILKFSRLLKAGEWQQKLPNGSFTHTNYAQLEEFYHLFEKLAKYLHKVITKLMECGYQRHLVELLAMINLNGYYDAKPKEETNISLQST